MIVIAAIAWAVLATAGGIVAAIGWRNCAAALAGRSTALAEALIEARRQKQWSDHWRAQAESLTGYLTRIPSRRGLHARAQQQAQQKALVHETAKRLAGDR